MPIHAINTEVRHHTARARLAVLAIGSAALLLLAGCFAPPKHHSWQSPQAELPRIRNSDAWRQLATHDYVRVPDSKRQEAVALLQEQSFCPLNAPQLSALAPEMILRTDQAYLVRGTSFSSRPAFTILQFNADTGQLVVRQFTYDGEILMPFRWVSEPNALVVFLPRPPEHIYPDAVLGGDGIFRGLDWKTLDSR